MSITVKRSAEVFGSFGGTEVNADGTIREDGQYSNVYVRPWVVCGVPDELNPAGALLAWTDRGEAEEAAARIRARIAKKEALRTAFDKKVREKLGDKVASKVKFDII